MLSELYKRTVFSLLSVFAGRNEPLTKDIQRYTRASDERYWLSKPICSSRQQLRLVLDPLVPSPSSVWCMYDFCLQVAPLAQTPRRDARTTTRYRTLGQPGPRLRQPQAIAAPRAAAPRQQEGATPRPVRV